MNLPQTYHQWILWIGDGTGLPDTILHIHAGLAILLVVRVVTRRSLATFIPFSIVVVAELGNEVMDYLVYGLRYADTLADIANTCFWPLVISVGVRLRPMATGDQHAQRRESKADTSKASPFEKGALTD